MYECYCGTPFEEHHHVKAFRELVISINLWSYSVRDMMECLENRDQREEEGGRAERYT